MNKTITKTSVILTAAILVVGIMVMTPGFGDAFAKGGATKTQISVWVGQATEEDPTIDSEKSFVVFNCDDEGTLTANGHLHKTNRQGETLTVTVQVDGDNVSPNHVDIAEAPVNKVGNANFHAVVEGLSAGEHLVQTHINQNFGLTYYINGADGILNDVTVVCG